MHSSSSSGTVSISDISLGSVSIVVPFSGLPPLIIPSDISSSQYTMPSIFDLAVLLSSSVDLPQYKFTTTQIEWIRKFIKYSPDSFVKIAADIQTMTSPSGILDIHDIPILVKLISDIYSSTVVLLDEASEPVNIILFVKFTIHVVLDSKIIVIPGLDNDIVEKLINTSLDLLATELPAIRKEVDRVSSSRCFYRFRSFLGC